MSHDSGLNSAVAATATTPNIGAPPAGQATSGGPAIAPPRPSSPPRSTTTTTGLLDIEKELTCSICTDTLYQPLTLLDCLHTFCGSCLKLWFAWLASQADADPDADAGRLRNPYTCPSCRAHVRGTRPDAKITTLLDMYLAANPGKGKSEEEKAEMREKYSPGDNVVPRLTESWDEINERRRSELSQRSAGRRAHGDGYQRGVRHHAAPRRSGEEGGDGSDGGRAQHLGHQSSLRSLMSMDDSIDSEEMEAEIMRQIIEEGLLEGINVDDLTSEQHEELAERIANAYRRRQEDRLRSRRRSPDNEDRRRDSPRRRDASRHRDSSRRTNASRRQDSPSAPSGRSTDAATRRTPAGSPAVSLPPSPGRSPVRSARRSHANSTSEAHSPQVPPQREDLLQAYPADTRRRRRSSDSRRQTAPVANSASRSATDLSIRPDISNRPSPTGRFASGSGSEVSSHRLVLRDSPLSRSPHGSPVHSPPQSPPITGPNRIPSRTNSLTAASMAPSVVPLEHTINQSPTVVSVSNANYHHSASVTAPSQHGRTGSFSNAMPGVSRLQGFSETMISCDSCKRRGIQYEVHHNCQSCRGGKFNLCDRCYKIGRGCENWYGFGHAAWQRYQAKGAPSPQLPHVLLAVQYRRPEADEMADGSSEARPLTKNLAHKRKRVGAYCYGCSAYAEDFFYRCERCNDGEWGFCRDCVNQGRCCTHDLLPVAGVATGRNETSAADAAHGVHATFAHHISDPAAMIQPFPPSTTNTSRLYRPLTVTTTCDRCRRAIPPDDPRFHCPRCNDGTLELCSPCYAALQDTGVIDAPRDGGNGWRRCPRRHRMIVLVYAHSDAGPRRVVLNDLVGGHFLKDEQDRDASPDGTEENTVAAAIAPTTTTTGFIAGGGADPADAHHRERRYNWQDGDTGMRSSTTLSRPKATAAGLVVEGSIAGGSGGGGAGSSSSNSGPKFPPDGGVGKRCVARWSWIPELGVANELMFPKGAEVTEVLDVNNKWCEGSYAGAKGVFPTNYVKVLDFVTM